MEMKVNAKARFLKYLGIPAVEFVHVHVAVTKLQAKLSENIIDHKENQKIMSCFSSKFILVIHSNMTNLTISRFPRFPAARI